MANVGLFTQLHSSHHHQLFFPFFDSRHKTERNTRAESKKSGISNQQTYIRSLCPLNWFQLLLPHHWHRNKWAVFYQSWNVQTCEFNQVHRRLWLETHAAFLSYDLITRLFSSRVRGGSGAHKTVHGVVLEDEWVLSVVWCEAPEAEAGMCRGQWRWSGLRLWGTAPWELLINQIIAVSKWRRGVGGGWLPDVKIVTLAVFGEYSKRLSDSWKGRTLSGWCKT